MLLGLTTIGQVGSRIMNHVVQRYTLVYTRPPAYMVHEDSNYVWTPFKTLGLLQSILFPLGNDNSSGFNKFLSIV